jgi:hypothetical protein
LEATTTRYDYPDIISLVQLCKSIGLIFFLKRKNKVRSQNKKTLENESVQDAKYGLDIRMALDTFRLSGRPLLLCQRKTHTVDASLERGALERFPGDGIVTVSINERYSTSHEMTVACLGISHFFCETFLNTAGKVTMAAVLPCRKHKRMTFESGLFSNV